MPLAALSPVTVALALALIGGSAAWAADAGRPRLDTAHCPGDVRCRRPPGPPDRDIRPLIDPLGRPCGVRWRETPSGPRRVRVCY
ncbi:hypothetical protein LPC10_09850 [Methylorubrum sp. B1-46]|uniref:hypothetical protein n=1 Tax=Methylorubrum sp. B1-46 TaxID=2897334 RepID=UPI001E5671FD|nr:hypothetical protein [Methylorubrum sp. B1-46]UGB27838.1 hypothetical protein LPC10_09850 [Methylorubrum sp. B1-46]